MNNLISTLQHDLNGKFLSEERNITLNSLYLRNVFSDKILNEDILFDFHLLNDSVEEFLNADKSFNVSLKLCQFIDSYNSNFDVIYHKKKEIVKRNLFWISSDFDIIDTVDLLYSDDNCDFLSCVLLITSITENSLANLHFQISDKVPNMLTDLLNTQILKDILSENMINLLSVFIGSPSSLNLRNLSWHGYLWDIDFSMLKKYSKFIIIILWNIGETIRTSHSYLDFSKRYKTTKFPEFPVTAEFLSDPFCLSEISSIPFLIPVLRTIDRKMSHKNHYQALCLMLPVFEFSMRMLYISINNLPSDLSVAVSHEYFVTEDVIISKVIENTDRKNDFIDYIGVDFATVVAEIFMLPCGPRLKDIISHGEVTVVDNDLSAWAYLMRYLLFFLIGIHEGKHENERVNLIGQWIEQFQPRYHCFAVIKSYCGDIPRRIGEIIEREFDAFQSIPFDMSFDDDVFLPGKLSILFLDREIVTVNGMTLKVVANQIVHIQQQIEIVLTHVAEIYACGDRDSMGHIDNFVVVIGDLLGFLGFVSGGLCRRLFDLWIGPTRDEGKLMGKPLVKLLKRGLMSLDKVRSLTMRHKWTEMRPIFGGFYEDYSTIDWGSYFGGE